jgi:hypothetical protein
MTMPSIFTYTPLFDIGGNNEFSATTLEEIVDRFEDQIADWRVRFVVIETTFDGPISSRALGYKRAVVTEIRNATNDAIEAVEARRAEAEGVSTETEMRREHGLTGRELGLK